jgi:hypothetical protein
MSVEQKMTFAEAVLAEFAAVRADFAERFGVDESVALEEVLGGCADESATVNELLVMNGRVVSGNVKALGLPASGWRIKRRSGISADSGGISKGHVIKNQKALDAVKDRFLPPHADERDMLRCGDSVKKTREYWKLRERGMTDGEAQKAVYGSVDEGRSRKHGGAAFWGDPNDFDAERNLKAAGKLQHRSVGDSKRSPTPDEVAAERTEAEARPAWIDPLIHKRNLALERQQRKGNAKEPKKPGPSNAAIKAMGKAFRKAR